MGLELKESESRIVHTASPRLFHVLPATLHVGHGIFSSREDATVDDEVHYATLLSSLELGAQGRFWVLSSTLESPTIV